MSNNLITQQVSTLAAALNVPDNGELISVLKSTAFKGQVSDAQMSALLIVANQYNLNPWTREIYAFPDKNNGIVPVVGVDGWSRIMNEHPQFDGMEFEQNDDSCTCTIYRKDRNHPISATEYMSECNRKTGPWQSHPKRMLRHKAMIQAARLAFSFTGIYDEDEAERIKEINPTPSRVTGTQAAQAARPTVTIDPQQEAEREDLIEELEKIAEEQGMQAYGEKWLSLTIYQRKLVGADEHERLKGVAQDFENAIKAAPQVVDSFVAEMEAAE